MSAVAKKPIADSRFVNRRAQLRAPEDLLQHEFITYQVSILCRIFDRRAERNSQSRRGISLTDCRVLGQLWVHRQATVRWLATEMHLLRPQISRSMAALMRRGYVRRTDDPSDGRSALFIITPKGEQYYIGILASGRRRQRELADLLGETDFIVLQDIANRLIEILVAIESEEQSR